MGVTRINRLTDQQRAQFDAWADKWIEIGLRTGPADRERFEGAVRDCYKFAGIPFPDVVVWVPSPFVLALAAPAAAYAIELIEAFRRHPALRKDVATRDAVIGAVIGAVRGAVRGAVTGAVRDAVDVAVGGAVRGAVGDAVSDAVDVAVRGAVDGAVTAVGDAVDVAVRGAVGVAVRGAVSGAVGGAVTGAVDDAVRGAVDDAVGGAVDGAVRDAVDVAVNVAVRDAEVRMAVLNMIRQSWNRYLWGQFAVGGWYWGGAWTSFFREICKLELIGDLWDRGRAFEATMESACWWWPHRRFVMVSERPLEIHRELVNPTVLRGWGSHRLHREDGPAVVWPDGWGVYSVHGVRVPADVIEGELTVDRIVGERNAEVRRVMLDRFGADRYIRETKAQKLDADEFGTLWRAELEGDEPLVMVQVVNSTPEPDGSWKDYWIRVPPGCGSAREAVAWTFDIKANDYAPQVQT